MRAGRHGGRACRGKCVTIHPDGTWSCEQDTILIVPGVAAPFHHADRNTLTKMGEPTPKPLAAAARWQEGGRRRRPGSARSRVIGGIS